MKKYVVYKHTNKSNGKVYIGITSMNPERRWSGGHGYKNNRHFNGAIQKYGWDNFDHEILYENLEELQAKTLEISLIRFYNSTDPEKGYNISTGGEGHSGCHFTHSADSRKKMSKNHRGGTPKQRIICLEVGVEYESYADASRKTGLPRLDIRQSCIKGWACKGFHFKKL